MTSVKDRPGMPTVVQVGRYEIADRFTVVPPGDRTQVLEIWCPVIPDTPHQRVVNIEVRGEQPYELTREFEFGNIMLHNRRVNPRTETTLEIRYTVERQQSGGLMVDASAARPLASPMLFMRSLTAERHVDVDQRTRALAAELAVDLTGTVEIARRFYDHVTGTMSYDADQQSFLGSTDHALTCSVGNCNDIHALFVSLCRSAGIPARFIMGQALEPLDSETEDCEVCGYHCWAEFYVAGIGWLPADASCATKYGTHGLFGGLEINHVAWSVGRDLLLAPPQRAGRSLFFAGPYAEADGQPHHVERRLEFTTLS
ncbi:MAG: transglutaminase-like domain-containing protein [Microbacteriaceae bacterium]